MEFIPGKDNKGIWTIAVIILIMVAVMFLNTYAGPNKQPLFSFLKKKPATPPAAAAV